MVSAHSTNYPTAAEMASWCQPFGAALLGEGRATLNGSMQRRLESNVCYRAFLAIKQLAGLPFDGGITSALKLCLPKTDRLTELVKVFMRYADEHPKKKAMKNSRTWLLNPFIQHIRVTV